MILTAVFEDRFKEAFYWLKINYQLRYPAQLISKWLHWGHAGSLLQAAAEARNYSGYSDAEIIELVIKERNPEPFRIIYQRYADRVYRKCLSFTHEVQEAEDLTHDVFLKTYLKLSQFKAGSSFSTWLYAITYNFCIDYKRKKDKQKVHKAQYGYEKQAMEGEGDESELFAINMEQLSVLLDRINPDEKALLLMKYQDEIPIKGGITEITNLSEGAVKMRLKRARQKVVKLSKELQSL